MRFTIILNLLELIFAAGHGYDVRDVAVSADNSKFASAGGDRQLFLWDVATGQTIRKFAGHDGVINSVRPVARSVLLLSCQK